MATHHVGGELWRNLVSLFEKQQGRPMTAKERAFLARDPRFVQPGKAAHLHKQGCKDLWGSAGKPGRRSEGTHGKGVITTTKPVYAEGKFIADGKTVGDLDSRTKSKKRRMNKTHGLTREEKNAIRSEKRREKRRAKSTERLRQRVLNGEKIPHQDTMRIDALVKAFR